jgi:hypothetical protein
MEKTICKNPWCKGTFEYKEEEMVEIDGVKAPPQQCKKCKSFANELSAGIEWKDKKYEGSRDDGMAHEISYKVNKYYK